MSSFRSSSSKGRFYAISIASKADSTWIKFDLYRSAFYTFVENTFILPIVVLNGISTVC